MADSLKKLEGRVAAILNARELVINLGKIDGVTLGMKFAVLAESPIEVRDPNTKEILDIFDREKTRVKISEIREKASICRTYRITKIPGGPFNFSVMSNLTQPPREVPETLSIHDSSMPPPLSEEESYVKVNDRVIQILDE